MNRQRTRISTTQWVLTHRNRRSRGSSSRSRSANRRHFLAITETRAREENSSREPNAHNLSLDLFLLCCHTPFPPQSHQHSPRQPTAQPANESKHADSLLHPRFLLFAPHDRKLLFFEIARVLSVCKHLSVQHYSLHLQNKKKRKQREKQKPTVEPQKKAQRKEKKRVTSNERNSRLHGLCKLEETVKSKKLMADSQPLTNPASSSEAPAQPKAAEEPVAEPSFGGIQVGVEVLPEWADEENKVLYHEVWIVLLDLPLFCSRFSLSLLVCLLVVRCLCALSFSESRIARQDPQTSRRH